MPRNNNPQGHNQYTNKNPERSDQTAERSASPQRDERQDNANRQQQSNNDSDRSVSGRPASRS